MKYNSEAQAYQAIRRDLKHRLNYSQRAQTIYMWEALNRTKHPNIVQSVAKSMGCDKCVIHIPISAIDVCLREAAKHQTNASMYQNFLNQYKITEE